MKPIKYDMRQMCLFDDIFFRLCFEDFPEGTEFMLQVILGNPNIKVIDQHVQFVENNTDKRGVRLDVYAEDANDGSKYNIEVDKGNLKDLVPRSRYYSSVIDSRMTMNKKDPYRSLPKSYVIFICVSDIMEQTEPMKWYTRKANGTNEELGDGSNIIFVNGSYNGDDDIGRLIHDMKEKDPSKVKNKILEKRIASVKIKAIEEKGEENTMVVTYFDELIMKEREEQALDTAKRMLADGSLTIDKIAQFTALPIEKVKELADSMTA